MCKLQNVHKFLEPSSFFGQTQPKVNHLLGFPGYKTSKSTSKVTLDIFKVACGIQNDTLETFVCKSNLSVCAFSEKNSENPTLFKIENHNIILHCYSRFEVYSCELDIFLLFSCVGNLLLLNQKKNSKVFF